MFKSDDVTVDFLTWQSMLPPSPRLVAIYGLWDPSTDVLRYIGASIHPERRAHEHCSNWSLRENTRKTRWLRSLLDKEIYPVCHVLVWVERSQRRVMERLYISEARAQGYDLTNGTDGGEVGPEFSGISSEGRVALGIAARARRLGTTLSPEHRSKISATLRERLKDPEIRKKRSVARSEWLKDPVHLEQVSKTLRDCMKDPAMRERQCASVRGVIPSDETRAKISQAKRGRRHTAESRASMSAGQRGRVCSPETRARMKDAQQARRALEKSRDKSVT